MNFQTAIQSCFRNYAGFSGRAPRSEYWYFCLFVGLMGIICSILDMALFHPSHSTGPIGAIFTIATLLPSIAVTVRRLHDVDRGGWWFLLILIPLVGAVIILIWSCTKGTTGPNRFGPDPLVDYIDVQPANNQELL